MTSNAHPWTTRVLWTLAAAERPLRAKHVQIRCGCLTQTQGAKVRRVLRRLVEHGDLRQDALGRYLSSGREA